MKLGTVRLSIIAFVADKLVTDRFGISEGIDPVGPVFPAVPPPTVLHPELVPQYTRLLVVSYAKDPKDGANVLFVFARFLPTGMDSLLVAEIE